MMTNKANYFATAAIGLTLSLSIATTAMGAKLAGVEIPDNFDIEGKSLQLNGIALREATIFNVDVYVAGLYVESPSQEERFHFNSADLKHIYVKFKRDVGQKRMVESWYKQINKNCIGNCDDLLETVRRLSPQMPDVKQGQTMAYTFAKDWVKIYVNEKEMATIQGNKNRNVMLNAFIGRAPATKDLKKGLLGQINRDRLPASQVLRIMPVN